MLHQPPQSGALGHPILTGHLPTQVPPLPASFSVGRSLGEPRLPRGILFIPSRPGLWGTRGKLRSMGFL